MLRRAFVVSLLVHVVLLLAVQLWPRRPGRVPDPNDTVVELEIAPPPAPLAPPPAPAAPPPAAPATAGIQPGPPATAAEVAPDHRAVRRERRSPARPEREAPPTAPEPQPRTLPAELPAEPPAEAPAAPAASAAELPPGGSLLRMRAPQLDLRADPSMVVAPVAPVATAPVRPGPIVPLGPLGGPASPARPELHRDHPGFEASVAPDGQARIENHAPVRFGDQLDRRKLREWWDDPDKHKRGDEPTVARLDATDIAMRLAGQDPYRAEKQKFLESTREQRIAMAMAAGQKQQERALGELEARLQSIWRSMSPGRQRRQLLFALWDECTEAGPDADAASNPGERARAAIVRFIRANLPEGSRDAYPADELAALNQGRQSRRKFIPYRVSSAASP